MWQTLVNFFEMGGYALYLWPAYGLAMMTIVGHVYYTRRQSLRLKQQWIQAYASE